MLAFMILEAEEFQMVMAMGGGSRNVTGHEVFWKRPSSSRQPRVFFLFKRAS